MVCIGQTGVLKRGVGATTLASSVLTVVLISVLPSGDAALFLVQCFPWRRQLLYVPFGLSN